MSGKKTNVNRTARSATPKKKFDPFNVDVVYAPISKKPRNVDVTVPPPSRGPLEHRTSLNKLVDVNNVLTEDHKKEIRSLGFGVMTDLQISGLDNQLLRKLVDNFNVETKELTVDGVVIEVSSNVVHWALGLPCTNTLVPNIGIGVTVGKDSYQSLFSKGNAKLDKLKKEDRKSVV